MPCEIGITIGMVYTLHNIMRHPIFHMYCIYAMSNKEYTNMHTQLVCDSQRNVQLCHNNAMCNRMCNMPCAIGSNTIGVGDAPLSTPSCPLMALPTSLIPSSSSSLYFSSSARHLSRLHLNRHHDDN